MLSHVVPLAQVIGEISLDSFRVAVLEAQVGGLYLARLPLRACLSRAHIRVGAALLTTQHTANQPEAMSRSFVANNAVD
jgi:hypothetical protein